MKKPWDLPNPVRVELATNPRTQAPAWSEISAAVKGNPGVTVNRTGRSGRFERTQPSRGSFVVDNRTGQFSDLAGSAPTLFGKRVRVSVRDWSVLGNALLNPDFNVANGVTNWGGAAFGYAGTAALTVSTTRSLFAHTQSMLITWPTQAASTPAYAFAPKLVIGRKYEAVFIVWVGSGPAVTLKDLFGASGGVSTTTGAWQVLRYRFTAAATDPAIGLVATNTTAGQQVWLGAARVDEGWTTGALVTAYTSLAAAGHTNLALAGAVGSPVTYRLTGSISGNKIGWPARGIAHTPITVVDRSARLASRTRTFRSVPEEEMLSDTPFGLYPLSEPASSVSAGDIGPGSLRAMAIAGAGTAPGFGGTQASPTSDATGVTFAAGKYLQANWATSGVGGAFNYSFGTLVRTTSTTLGVVEALRDGFGPIATISTTAAGKARFDWPDVFDFTGIPRPSLTSTATVNDGLPHHVLVTATQSGGNVTFRLYVDGVLDQTSSAIPTPFLPFGTVLSVGGTAGSVGFTGLVAYAGVWAVALTGAQVTEHAAAALTGFSGEATYARLVRYARWAGIPQSEIVLDPLPQYAGLMAHIDSKDQSPWEMMGACEVVEGGLLNIDGAGNVRFRSRGSFYNQDAGVSLNASTTTGNNGVVQDSLEFPTDNSTIVNDLTGTRPGGATQRTINQASIDEYERAEDDVTIPATTDEAVADALAWRVGLLSNPKPRAEGLAVRLTHPSVSDALTAQIMALEPGSRVDVTDLPSQAPASTMSLVVEGWTERYSHSEGAVWDADSTSAALPAIWTLEDPVNGAIDSVAVIAY